jgi:hypothetical protein
VVVAVVATGSTLLLIASLPAFGHTVLTLILPRRRMIDGCTVLSRTDNPSTPRLTQTGFQTALPHTCAWTYQPFTLSKSKNSVLRLDPNEYQSHPGPYKCLLQRSLVSCAPPQWCAHIRTRSTRCTAIHLVVVLTHLVLHPAVQQAQTCCADHCVRKTEEKPFAEGAWHVVL